IDQFQQLSWFISAAVVLADWTGSASRYFPRTAEKMPVDTYWQQALAKAQTAITLFPSAANVSAFTGIETLFPFIQHPTP
ncbi:hypothetical protein, partial [Salmonella enterica]